MKIIFAIVIVIAVKFYDNGEYHYVAVGADQNIAVSIR